MSGLTLKYSARSFVVAKDSKNKRVRLGGLGALGVGQMVFKGYDEYKNHDGFVEAPDEELGPSFLEALQDGKQGAGE